MKASDLGRLLKWWMDGSIILHTLYGKLALGLLVVLLVLGVSQFFLFSSLSETLSDQSRQVLNARLANEVASQFEPFVGEQRDYWAMQKISHQVMQTNPGIAVYLIDEQGRIAADFSASVQAQRARVDTAPIERFLRASHDTFPIYGDDPRKEDRRAIFSAALLQSKPSPYYVYVLLQSDRQSALNRVLERQFALRKILIVVSISIALAVMLGLLLVFVITKRFHGLKNAVLAYQRGDFSTRVPVSSNDEVGELAQAVNKMADTIVSNISELERRDRLRRELVANVSHDLRRPVAIISTLTEYLMGRTTRRGSVEDIAPDLTTLHRSANSLAQLLAQLFELSKLEAKEVAPELIPICLDEIIEDTYAHFRSVAEEQRIDLNVAPAGSSAMVWGDVLMIERVLGNLVENALAFTDAGGTITIRTEALPGKIRVSVRDTGAGIPADKAERVFESFYQVEPERNGRHPTAGLGLAIVKRILEAHNSDIYLQSVEGEGTVFWFDLNVIRETEEGRDEEEARN